jgi:Tol biopolymer transport system component/DNA-binding winged helix-turn-helix (wHTH) protein
MARWQIGGWSFDTAARTLRRDDQTHHLPLKVSEVLRALAERHGEVVTTNELIASIWDDNRYTGPRGVRNAIWSLRRILDNLNTAPGAIENIAKTGYRLTLPAELSAISRGVLPDPETIVRNSGPGHLSTASKSRDARAAENEAPPGHSITKRFIAGVIASTFTMMLIIAALVTAWSPAREPSTVTIRPEPVTFYDGMEEFPSPSPDRRWLAFTWEREHRASQIFLKDLRDGSTPLRQFTLGSGNEVRPVWSADGSDIAFARTEPNGDCHIYIRNVTTLSERKVTDCFYERLHQVLDWSPDGKTLAIARRDANADTVSIYLFDLQRNSTRRLTTAPSGTQDSQLAWSPDSRDIAFVRRDFTAGEVHIVNVATGRSRAVTADRAPIYGLTWSHKTRRVIFNSMRDGTFALWSVPTSGGTARLLSRIDTPFNMSVLPGSPEKLIVSQHKTAEYLETRSRSTGRLLATIASGGRDMYAQWSPALNRLLYTSNRTGRFQLWTSDISGNDARAVNPAEPLVSTFSWSPSDARYAATARESGAPHDQLYIGNVEANVLKAVTSDGYDYRSPTWDPKGRSLLVSTNRSGSVEIWRYKFDDKSFVRLTTGGGLHAQQVGDHLYYTRPDLAGLWARDLTQETAPQLIVPDLAADDWGSWQIEAGILYYVTRTTDSDLVVAHALDGTRTRKVLVTLPRNAIRIYKSLTLAGTDEMVITTLGRRQVDIVSLTITD